MENRKSTRTPRVSSITPSLWVGYVADLGAGWSISEMYGSDDMQEGIPTKHYLSEGHGNVFDIQNAILALSPAAVLTVGGKFCYRKAPSISHVDGSVDAYTIDLTFAENTKEDAEPGETWSRTATVSCSLEQEKHLTSLETVDKGGYSNNVPVPDFKNSVNVTPNGVEGVDVGVPTATITIETTTPVLPDATVWQIQDELGTVNNAGIFGRDAGEVLFSGFSYSQDSNTSSKCRFEFQVRKNEQNPPVAGNLVAIASKDGWDYLWYYLEQTTDNTANLTVTTAKAWYIERVYPRSAWTNTKAICGTTINGLIGITEVPAAQNGGNQNGGDQNG